MKFNKPYPFDVDDTLIQLEDFDKSREGVSVINPQDNSLFIVKPMAENLSLLKDKFDKGHEIILWSQSGADYAESVAKALKIDHLISLYMTKPQEYCDDLPASAWMNRVFKEIK